MLFLEYEATVPSGITIPTGPFDINYKSTQEVPWSKLMGPFICVIKYSMKSKNKPRSSFMMLLRPTERI